MTGKATFAPFDRAKLVGNWSRHKSGSTHLSTVEARARGGGRGGLGRESFLETKKVFSKAHGWISLNQAISCECRGGSAEQVVFEEGALDDMVSGARPTMAILGGGFESAVASTVKKTLRFSQQKGRVVYV